MKNKLKVKVIKKDELKAVAEQPAPEETPKQPSKKAAAREMVSTVGSWVSDFQKRKRGERGAALEHLFSTSPAASRL